MNREFRLRAGVCAILAILTLVFLSGLTATANPEVVLDSNNPTPEWVGPDAFTSFTTYQDTAVGRPKVFKIRKLDKSMHWAHFGPRLFPVDKFQGMRLSLSFSMKVDSPAPFSEWDANYLGPDVLFFPNNTTASYLSNCGVVHLGRSKTAPGWTDYRYDVDVPAKARYAVLRFSFDLEDGVVEIANVRITHEALDQETKTVLLSPQDLLDKTKLIKDGIGNDLSKLSQALTPYEKSELKPREQIASYAIGTLFQDHIEEDIKAGEYSLAFQEAKESQEIVRTALAQIQTGDFILSQEKSILGVKARNGRFVNSNGETLYLLGYGQSYFGCPDYALKKQLGINFESLSWRPQVEVLKDKTDYSIAAPILDSLHQPRERRDHNIALNMYSFIPKRIPEDPIHKLYPESKVPGNNVLDYDPDHPAIQQFFDRAGAAYGKGYEQLPDDLKEIAIGTDIANEPALSSITKYTMESFRHYLKQKYPSIDSLNLDWHTTFAGFESIDDIRPLLREGDHRVARYDWCIFNQQRLYSTLKRIRDAIKSNASGNGPEIYAKFMNSEIWTSDVILDRGYDRELLEGVCDVNGGDGWTSGPLAGSPYSINWMHIAVPLDHLYSIAPGKPLFDDEWHAVDPSMTEQRMRAALWLSAWHGQCGTDLFAMLRDKKRELLYGEYPYGSGPWYDFASTWGADLHPSLMKAYSQEGIRIENSIDRVRRFTEADRPICIYQSMPSAIYDGKKHVEMVEALYEAFYFHNVGIGFVTEHMLKEKRIPQKRMKLLIIPNARYIDAAAIPYLKRLDAAGVRILIVGEESLTRDLQDRRYPETLQLKNALYWRLGGCDEYRAQSANALKWAGIGSLFSLRDNSGQGPEFVAARFSHYGNKRIGYAINLGTNVAEFSVCNAFGKPVRIRNYFQTNHTGAEVQSVIRLGPCELMNFDIVD